MIYPLPHKTNVATSVDFNHVPETKIEITVTEPEHLIILHHTASRAFYQITSKTTFGSIYNFAQMMEQKKQRIEERKAQRMAAKEAKINARLARNNSRINSSFD